ncbi:MAG: hypothetical protein ACJAUP_002969 [Cellvibrionaceae bacterium]|jgi:hypothetical protein
MSMNKIQFQKSISFEAFYKAYGTVDQCEEALVQLRWPLGYYYPRCNGKRAALTDNRRRLWECLDSRYQRSSIAGTIFEATKLPLIK